MFFSTTLLFAFAGLASAAPTLHNRDSNCGSDVIEGIYRDQGCGEVLHPTLTGNACFQTEWSTVEHSPLSFGKCVSSNAAGGVGGRWAFKHGNTQIVNRQADSADFCISATESYTGLEMARCQNLPRQTWDWDGKRFKLADRDLCLSSIGVVDAHDKVVKDQVWPFLGPCSDVGSPNVQLITTLENMPESARVSYPDDSFAI